MEVASVDERDVGVDVTKREGRLQPAEAAADDDDAVPAYRFASVRANATSST